MNINELQEDIKDHKSKMADSYNGIVELMIPFHMLTQKLYTGISKLEEEKYKLGNSEADALITTYVSGDKEYTITPTKLQHKLLFTSGAITKVLKKLEDKNLIIRLESPVDKRSKLVRLTIEGQKIAKEVFIDIMQFNEKAFSSLSKKEKELLQKSIIKVLSHS